MYKSTRQFKPWLINVSFSKIEKENILFKHFIIENN